MADSMDFGVQILRVFGGLLVVLAILGGAVLALKKFGPYVQRPNVGGTLEVLSRHHLDPRNALLVVRVYEHHFLVGVSPQGLHMLSPLDPPSHEFQREQEIPGGGPGKGGGSGRA